TLTGEARNFFSRHCVSRILGPNRQIAKLSQMVRQLIQNPITSRPIITRTGMTIEEGGRLEYSRKKGMPAIPTAIQKRRRSVPRTNDVHRRARSPGALPDIPSPVTPSIVTEYLRWEHVYFTRHIG